ILPPDPTTRRILGRRCPEDALVHNCGEVVVREGPFSTTAAKLSLKGALRRQLRRSCRPKKCGGCGRSVTVGRTESDLECAGNWRACRTRRGGRACLGPAGW